MTRVLTGAATGVIAALLGFGVSEVVARGFGPASAPVLALGQSVIPLAPPALIEPALDLLGDNDKPVLVASTAVGIVLIGALIGVLGRSRPRLGLVCLAAAAVLPILAILLRPESTVGDIVPTLIGMPIGLVGYIVLLRTRAGGAVFRKPTEDRATDVDAGTDAGTTGNAVPRRTDRRRFLTLATVFAAVGTVTAVTGQTVTALSRNATAALASLVLPRPAVTAPAVPASASFDIKGLGPFLTRAKDFYRIDTVLTPPLVLPEDWSLRIHGMVDEEVTITMPQLLDLPLEEHIITLTCVSNPVGGDLVGNAVWLGYPVRELLRRASPHSDADMVLSRSVDGFTASTPLSVLEDDRAALVAVGMNGRPLLPEHGFPARLVVPGLYGFVSATKWVTELEVTRFDRKQAYWTQRGWDPKAPILVASRVEVPRPLSTVPPGVLTAAGTAWAQHTGIRDVEVRLDDGPWTPAELGTSVNADVWREWKAEFPGVRPGNHTLTVRATDRAGRVQISTRRDSIPNSATGLHHIQFRVD